MRRGARAAPIVVEVVQETSGNQSANAVETPAASRRPLLVYDGDCGFCGYWARYWKKLTGDRVDYRPYQEVAAQYPAIPLADFQRAVQFITPDGHHASAAEASFLTLSHARGKGFWLALYRKLPGFAAISEVVYAFIAAHRPAFYRVSLLLWGSELRTAALRSCLIPVPAPVWVDLPLGVRLLRRAGAGADRQPWHPAGGRTGRCRRQPFRAGAFLPDADGVLVERQRFRDSGGVLGGRGAVAAAGLQSAAAPEPVSALCALSLAVLWRASSS